MSAADPTPPMSAEEMRADLQILRQAAKDELRDAVRFEAQGQSGAAQACRYYAAEFDARASNLARRLEQQEKSR